ncbi:YpmS family protein [Lysinibacillus sp. SGAir0095]|uniref:YpmS family protein n=1 Tax=Lysinibacillus sp. SGAir0095 TaxID=2070463 RepID=UPI00143D6086|nr:YpmS family protein [Lysinibacillus sp. SGAir0095]
MNKWKVAFFTLTGAIILFITIIFYLATSPSEDVQIDGKNVTVDPTDSVLLVEATADDIEKIALRYLESELANSPLPLDIVVDKTIKLNSELTAFGVTVPFAMEFDPIVTEEGNIQLKQNSVNVGKINLEPVTVLKLMNDAVDFPEWIVVRPNDEEVYVDLSEVKVMDGAKVRAKEIDLENNRILLEVIVPNK